MYIFPLEMHPSKYIACKKLVSMLDTKSSENEAENKFISLKKLGKQYIRKTLDDTYRASSKLANCKANIYLHPPNEQEDSSLFYYHSNYRKKVFVLSEQHLNGILLHYW